MKCPKCGKPNAYSVALVGTYCAECYIKAHPGYRWPIGFWERADAVRLAWAASAAEAELDPDF